MRTPRINRIGEVVAEPHLGPGVGDEFQAAGAGLGFDELGLSLLARPRNAGVRRSACSPPTR